jgi:3',5'-cyclic AMP phosphodiesterase CpdA
MSTKIMHISDLHLGNDIVPRALWQWRRWWRPVDQKITDGLVDSIRQLKPDFVVLSGDIVNKPCERSFDEAAGYLRDVFLRSGFDMTERLLIVPGNHDVGFSPQARPDDFKRLRAYRRFLCALFGESDIEARRQRFVKTDPIGKVIFVCLDSTLKDKAPIAEGQVGTSQLRWMRRKIQTLAGHVESALQDYAKIAVLHHHCVPIAGTSASGERFMQLLDAGDVLKSFEELGINVVLHGHKHVPHASPQIRSDSSVLTVIGAGTTTCAFIEEQEAEGNNFNWINVSPESNQLSLTLYKANQKGEFRPGGPKLFPLKRVESLGYSTHRMRKAVTIERDGTMRSDVVREGIRVERPGKTIASLPMRIIATGVSSKIDLLDFDRDIAEPKFAVKTEALIEGEWVFKTPITYGGDPVTHSYSFTIKDGVAMNQADLARLYPAGQTEEYTAVVVSHPTHSLKMEVTFPHGFPAVPRVTIEHLGSPIPINSLDPAPTPRHDNFLNRFELEVTSPPLDHLFSIKWSVPKNWP